ncbi:NAD(P)H-dependent oxidoreductase [Teredinibacter sp. KSP-S5-2]|uniref:NADPH-dependent FMN reductase n=1 Tax=Teredinibacter sp. KSP-S5-2 TaxID=3034506 RepID=UPI002934593E|nr:NAD(P)H-dependent oxidoreductase [Teredinibacter sp. KSP-S5-2]WNO09386.1 NAD(P)H-dependent oxidoreductase [Teredinibacter sp. KSP-S5-2]
MKVLAFAATNSRQSINKQLATYATQLLDAETTEILDINDYEVPLFSIEREEELGQPEKIKQFYQKITDADALVIAFAEHNGTYTAAFKNLFDWASRINQKVWQGKPMVLLATSPGPGGAKNVLASAVTSAPFFGGEVKGQFSLPNFYDNFDSETGEITNIDFDEQLKTVVSTIALENA